MSVRDEANEALVCLERALIECIVHDTTNISFVKLELQLVEYASDAYRAVNRLMEAVRSGEKHDVADRDGIQSLSN